ncbi:2-methylaconitate cis-trans isomerase PrpF family protein [Denitromonas iodatirespirans]|uniref:2-methylaconitate cis-trans isomerase PrpF n=1 Tax=Denitromonas iodatirespirans TaxID=2795389 RepID=A0A944H9D7_DENI1|nr:PrpF domain-containing protein [Denitromonas iodatirespirans]MBT0963308.1 2-methylaconitate cis-trans isomerase PrpF [Denitromonas iodatirespirans]
MPQIRIPAAWMRGGTSKGVFLLASDLPAEPAERDAQLTRLLGSPDPYGKQIDGLGGATSSTSKVVIVAPSQQPDCDVDYWFGQVLIDSGRIDWSGNCGNLTAAVGPFALWRGLLPAAGDGEVNVRLWQGNVGKRIHARVPVHEGRPVEDGKFALDGVAFASAPITLTFLDPGSAEGGGILPTGRAVDSLTLDDGTQLDASLVSAGNPMVFVSAHALGLDATASQATLNADTPLRARCEQIRIAGALAMGLADTAVAAAERQHTPKVAVVAPPADCVSVDGRRFAASDLDLLTRVVSMGAFHHAIPGTAAIAIAAAAGVPGSLVSRQLQRDPVGPLRIGHPSGRSEVGVTTHTNQGRWLLEAAVLRRSARLLMDGWACLPG